MIKGVTMIQRVKQFIYAITAKMTAEDKKFVKTYLNEKEQELFFKLKVYEQTHCLRVAKSMITIGGGKNVAEEKEAIRIGLLHDIGKIKYPLNPIEKSIIVVLDKLTRGKIKQVKALKMVKCYYDHPKMSYELLCNLGDYEEEFLQVIKRHHEPLPQNEKVCLLKQCDEAA